MIKWLKSLFCRKKPVQKRVLEKVKVTKKFRKKNAPAVKKTTKRK